MAEGRGKRVRTMRASLRVEAFLSAERSMKRVPRAYSDTVPPPPTAYSMRPMAQAFYLSCYGALLMFATSLYVKRVF